MPRTNPDSELNIRRIDSSAKTKTASGGTHGFQVHFSRSGANYTRLFSDLMCGGKEAARVAAREFREILRESIPASRHGAGWNGPSRSNTGHMGVSITGGSGKDGSSTLYVEATVRAEKGKPVNRKFVARDTAELPHAIQKAVEWRESLLQKRLANERKNSEA